MINDILEQIKHRRLALGLTQSDMQSRLGMTRQQYQRIESGGNPRLETLLTLAEGLNLELTLVPRDRAAQVKAMLEGDIASSQVDEDPWHGLLGEDP